MKKYLYRLLACTAVCIALPVPSAMADANAGLDDIIAGHIVPRYQALEVATGDLSNAIVSDCKDGTLADAAAITAFKTALVAWQSIQHIRFGPIMVDDRHYRFEYWPDKHGQGARQVRKLLSAAASDIPTPANIGKASVAIQGFPALERIIHDTAVDNKARCTLAISISANLNAMSAATVREWSPWRPASGSDGVELIARNLSDQLGLMADLKLARPLGSSLAKARPRRAEHWRSSLSYAALAANFDGLHGLFEGENSRPGLRAAMLAAGGSVRQADQMAEHLKYGSTFIGWQRLPLHEAVSDARAREQVMFLVKHAHYTQELVKSAVYPALGLAMGFNSQDGD
jgi:predicted lipoprotein